MGYPLHWVEGRPREGGRKTALWRKDGGRITLSGARKRLADQVYAMTKAGKPWRVLNMILSTNIRFNASGSRDMNISRRDPDDPGVAFYFDLDGQPHALACDRWDTVQDNIAAIAAHIEALRGQERWGVADLRQAFAGHVALPAPDPWWVVLGVDRAAPIEVIHATYRALAKSKHPNAGGDRHEWDRLSDAYQRAKDERE